MLFFHRKDEVSDLLGKLNHIQMSKKTFDDGWHILEKELDSMQSSDKLFVSQTEMQLENVPEPVYAHSGLVRFVFSHIAVSSLAVVIILAGLVTTAIASHDSLPDEPLYTVKRAIEQTQIALSFSKPAKVITQTKHLSKRVAEVEELIARAQSKPETESKARVIKAITKAKDQADAVKDGLAKLDPLEDGGAIQELAIAAGEIEIVSYSAATAEVPEGEAKEIKEEIQDDIEPAASELALALDEFRKVADEKADLVEAIEIEGKGQDARATSTESDLIAGDEAASSTNDLLDDELSPTASSTDEEIEATIETEEVINQTTPETLINEALDESGNHKEPVENQDTSGAAGEADGIE